MVSSQYQPSARQTMEQKRAAAAWENVQSIKSKGKELEKGYRSLARSLNSMIQINGLGPTIGFLFAKSKAKKKAQNEEKQGQSERYTEHYYLLQHLTLWMQNNFKASNKSIIAEATDNGKNGLIEWITAKETSSSDYRRATTECLAFGLWLRRFAEGALEEDES